MIAFCTHRSSDGSPQLCHASRSFEEDRYAAASKLGLNGMHSADSSDAHWLSSTARWCWSKNPP